MHLPDLIEIVPLDKPVKAEITVPGSKSITNRALVLAALADGAVKLRGALWSEDTQIMVDCLMKLGFEVDVQPDADEFCNRTIVVQGQGGRIPNAGTVEQPLELFVGNAGTVARFLAAMVCLGDGVYRLSGVPRMHERPQAALFSALRELGYQVKSERGDDKLPAVIGQKSEVRSQKSERHCTVSIGESSQFASALMLSASVDGWGVEVLGENAEESPYITMTTEMIKIFLHHSGDFRIEPDASSGSYFIGTWWLLNRFSDTGTSEIRVAAWPSSGWQVDARMRTVILEKWQRDESVHTPTTFGITNQFSRQHDLADSIMTVITLAPLAEGVMTGHQSSDFLHLGRLRVQECDRVLALHNGLRNCGANIEILDAGDTLRVFHSQKLHGATIETYNDHRMAMCFAILGLKVPGIKIQNPACVKKTFPNFFQKLATPPPRGLGAEIRDGRTGQRLELDELFAE